MEPTNGNDKKTQRDAPDYLAACVEARDLARRTNVAYVYKLRSGRYYVSSSPPSTINAEYVASFERGLT
jgi:hypothetical protein